MTARTLPRLLLIAVLALVLATAWAIYDRLGDAGAGVARKPERLPTPVEVAAVEVGPIERRRTFTATLEARAEFVVAPKIAGRIDMFEFDLADSVRRGDVVAVLDDAEYVQEVARARADLAVEKASHNEALGLLRIAERELERLERLQARGNVSESQLDTVRSQRLAKRALTEVTLARIARAEAELEAARIRLDYTQVKANWQGGNPVRVVAQRYVDAGETVAANAPLLRIVELDPITAVFFATERDYAQLAAGQQASLDTDAFAGQSFPGSVARIAPVFSESTRQARVELRVDNPDLRLKPGMFARITVLLESVAEAVIVPEQALTTRDDRVGVFVVNESGDAVHWQTVETGIRQGRRIQILEPRIDGRVVVLGQQLLDHGSAIRIAAEADT